MYKKPQPDEAHKHSDDGHLHNLMPMKGQYPPDANSEVNYEGAGEDDTDGDEDEID